MSLEERAGQLIMVPVLADGGSSEGADAVAQLIGQRHLGSVLFLGDGWDSAAEVAAASLKLRQAAGPVGLWLAADQEGGRVQRLHGDGFDRIPSGMEQGDMPVAALTEAAQSWAEQLAGAGINLSLAPVLDAVDPADRAANASIGALDRDFGLDPDGNAAHGVAVIKGLRQGGVGSVVKHFPGLGGVAGNTDFTAAAIADSTTTADGPVVKAFATALAESPTMVMVSLAVYLQLDPDSSAALSHRVVSQLLRDDLGWDGVVVSDSLTAAAVSAVPLDQRAVRLIEAGGDLACFGSVEAALAALDGLIGRAKSDLAFAQLVDIAAGRVLAAKQADGLI
jgi:beta-N-acetylhexosaminidase